MAVLLDESLRKEVEGIRIRARGLVDAAFAGRYETAFKGQGMEFEEIREYQPGDDIRHIDWNTTARLGRPFVKIHRDERELTVFLLADLSGSTRVGSRRLKSRVAAQVGAILAYCALRGKDRVGLMLFSDRVEHVAPPSKRRSHAWQVIRDILSFEPQSKGSDLVPALERLFRVQRRRAVVFLLSDFLGYPLPKELAMAARRYDVVALEVQDPLEWELPDVGCLEWEDAESGERLHLFTGARERRAWRARALEERDRRKEFFLRHGIDRVEIPTDGDIGERLRRYFAQRPGRGAVR